MIASTSKNSDKSSQSWFNFQLGRLTRQITTSPFASIIAVFILVAGIWGAKFVITWGLINASWSSQSLHECRAVAPDGACWAIIRERYNQFLFGFYPAGERIRPLIVFILLAIACLPLVFPNIRRKGFFLFLAAIFPFIAGFLIYGGWGLQSVSSNQIGGFLLTFMIGVSAIAFSLPLGILLALGRRSKMVAVSYLCTGFIELIRGVPLIAVLFIGSVLLNYFLPKGMNIDIMLRVIVVVVIFAAAYVAEVIRGSLIAIPRGQYEASIAMGFSYWQMMFFIILPQALRLSIPGLMNIFIGIFKDTTLVSIIGLFDPLGIINPIRSDPQWGGIVIEPYLFVAVIFFGFCFGMSRLSQRLERYLAKADRQAC